MLLVLETGAGDLDPIRSGPPLRWRSPRIFNGKRITICSVSRWRPVIDVTMERTGSML